MALITTAIIGSLLSVGAFAAVDYLAFDGNLTNGVFQGLYNAFAEGSHYLLAKILDNIPISDANYQWLIDIGDVVGYFFPLDVAISLLAAYLVFVSLFIIVKFVIKLIPTVG